MSLHAMFKEYCKVNIQDKATYISEIEVEQLTASINNSPLKLGIQAYSILDFFHYKHLASYGFDTYFGYINETVSAEAILNMVHPEDQEAFGKLYYLCLEGLLNMPIPTKEIGHFCVFYRMRHAAGHYLPVLETNNIIACDAATNIPLINLATISVIDKPLANFSVDYYFNIKDEKGSVDIMTTYFNNYSNKVNIFRENDIKIAKLIKDGLSSTQIGEKLFLSKHSIDKYRKQLLDKTQCLNSHQLVTYMSNLNLI